MSQNVYATMDSPVGEIILTSAGQGLTGLHFAASRHSAKIKKGVYAPAHFMQAIRQLNEYFTGRRKSFDLPLAPEGTEFQKRVWKALSAIPYGETRTYGEIAALAGNPKASRAVGLANNKNPIGIIVPCHRVVGADGKLTGYAGGLKAKEWLLDLEACRSCAIAA